MAVSTKRPSFANIYIYKLVKSLTMYYAAPYVLNNIGRRFWVRGAKKIKTAIYLKNWSRKLKDIR